VILAEACAYFGQDTGCKATDSFESASVSMHEVFNPVLSKTASYRYAAGRMRKLVGVGNVVRVMLIHWHLYDQS
jgi:hypothetical protein